jgi:hypothetical protein
MTSTLLELKEKLASIEETELIDMLGVTSDQIVEAFEDIIEDKFEQLENQVD